MYRCESWTVKKAEYWRIDAFELWCWRRLLRVPWTARRSNQSIINEIRLMLKLKLQYFGHLMQRTDSLEKTWCWERLKAGGEGDDRGWDGWMATPTQWTWVWVISGIGNTGKLGTLQSTGSQRVGHDWTTELNCIKSTGQFMGVLTSLNIIREIVKRPHLEWGRDLALNYIWSFGYHGGPDILFTELKLCM